RPIVLRTDPRSEPIIALSVAGDADLWTLKELAESVFRRRLEQVDGIAQATVAGGLDREIQVDVDPRRLEAYNLTIDDLAAALAGANAASPSGTIRRGRYRYSLRTLGELQSVQEIGQILVAQPAGDTASSGRVLVSDVATVTDGFRERQSIARYNGRESIGLLIFKEADANTVRVAEQVDGVLVQLRAEYPEIEIEVATSQAGFIAAAISNLIQDMILGGVLAFLVLVLFLRDARYPIVIALAIPISIIGSFALLHAFGVSLNIMSLGGLALGIGMLVDNSIVVIENIFRHREKGLAAAPAAALGTEEVQRAITASTLSTVAVFGPIIYVEGVAGELFAALSFAVAFTLLASLVVAVTLLPTMAARWEGEKVGGLHEPSSPLLYRLAAPLRAFDRAWERVAAFYERSLQYALEHRGRTIAVSLALLAVTVPFALDLERSVLPDVDQGEFRVRVELELGTALEATTEVVTAIEQRLLADPDVDAVFSRVGKQLAAAGIEEDQSGLHTALLDVRLKSGRTTTPVIGRIRQGTTAPPGGTIDFETGQATALGRLLGGGEADLAVRIRGDDLDAALAYAGELRGRLVAREELMNVRVGTELGQPEYLIQLDRDRAASYGLDARTVAATIENYMRGNLATQYVDFDRKIDIYVRLPEDARRSLETLDLLRVQG
ncbi:MAG TPA: efflux RND transporter permease subunit, partial [Methylomirabilota bacterium]|nr:efflux RND transporter permease subunit [Methylomirabilota bacterium]